MNSARTIFSTLSLALVVSLSGCSWFGSGSGDGDGLSESELAAQREGRFGSGSIPTAEGEGMFADIHFGYDSYAVDDQARMDLEKNAQILGQQSDLKVTLEGHCDERGTREYNIALGEKRANSVKKYLVANGVEAARVKTVSFGKERPAFFGATEAIFNKNRRAVTVVN